MNISNCKSLIELYFNKSKEKKRDDFFLSWLKPNYNKPYTWGEISDKILTLSKKIEEVIKNQDRCLLLSENRPEWLISDLAIMNAGGISVPIFTTYADSDYKYILEDCKPSVIIVSNQTQFDKIKNYLNSEIKLVISFEKINYSSLIFEEIFNNTNRLNSKENKSISRNSIACIIYTSGTSGNPKGVMLSHGGILSNCEGALDVLKPITGDNEIVFLTWLPLSHSYEHTVQFIQILLGAKIYYAESLDKLIPNMNIAKPTIMTAVPRFYQNLFNKINLNFKIQKGLKKILINKTIELGIKKLNNLKLSLIENILNFFCEVLVRKKIRNQFGGHLRAFVSGGGALDKNIGEFLNAIGLPTLQGYGLTEASPVVSCNLPNKIKIETVGPIFSTNQVKIAQDGEILVKGENIMVGYWNKKKETDEVIKNGWLHTGDIGELDSEGYLKITDRKKDIIVNFGGENISPVKIENLLCLNEHIKQSFVYGDKKNYLVAILVVEQSFNLEEEIKIYIKTLNESLSSIEKIKKYFLIKDEFTIENRMLTPTLKLKRKEITKKYFQQLENLY
ncbi:MAG: long-chain fatty acid--CoA ligase [Pelagibacteraceae bacterium]